MADATLTTITEEEARLMLPRFDADVAWRLGTLLREKAVARGHGVAIEVSRFGQTLFFTALPGATPDNAEWIRRKRNVAMRFHRSSLAMRLLCEEKGVTLAARYGLDERDHAASGGAVPIVVAGAGIVGAAVVSGLPDVEDHRLVVEALLELIAAG